MLSELELKEKRKQENLEAKMLDSIKTRIEKIKEIKQLNVELTEPEDHGSGMDTVKFSG